MREWGGGESAACGMPAARRKAISAQALDAPNLSNETSNAKGESCDAVLLS